MPDTRCFYHSDGNVEAIIPELIEIGTVHHPLKLACIGCGARAQTYTQLAARRPDQFQIVAGADPVPERVEKIRRISGNPEFRGFTSAEAILSAGKLADVMIVATQHNFHYENCRCATLLSKRGRSKTRRKTRPVGGRNEWRFGWRRLGHRCER